MSKEYMNDGSLSEKWKYRFNFYDQHGFPGFWGATPEYKAAFKALKVRQRLTIQMNFIAFLAAYVAVNTNKWFYEKEVKGLNTWSL